MKTREKVKINITAKKAELSPKANCKTGVRPQINRFLFKPRLFEQIQDSILKLDWNEKDKQIYLEMIETPDFDVLRWLKYIQDSFAKTESYGREFESSVILYFLNDKSEKIAQIKFRELSLLHHNCPMEYSSTKDLALKHTITIGYKFNEFLLTKTEQENLEFPAPPSNADDEWQNT